MRLTLTSDLQCDQKTFGVGTDPHPSSLTLIFPSFPSNFKDECSMEVVIRLPRGFPLVNVEVECRQRLGVTEHRWRRWVLQIVTMLSTQDGSVMDAVALWKENVDKEFEGLEPCPICYSVLHPKVYTLPSCTCHTCKNKFHKHCLHKWFQTSHQSKCPLCQQPFDA